MLKREHIKQAIEAISRRDPEIGYVLDEMLGMGRIRPAPGDSKALSGQDFYFTFDDHVATVRKGIFFNAGTVSIEERLLIKYGEMLKRHELVQTGKDVAYRDAAREIRQAGLAFMVNHEIAWAVAQAQALQKGADPLVAGFYGIKKLQRPLKVPASGPEEAVGSSVLFHGIVDTGKTAFFVQFPFCMDALIQVADINVDFFHVRFLLTCLARDTARNLFACVVDNRIEGMVYLTFKEQFLQRAMEIHYIATVRGRRALPTEPETRALKGIGTFLVAGVWLLWKTRFSNAKELLLDSEIGARNFYAAVGFQSRGMSAFVMKNPEGGLVPALIDLAGNYPDLPARAVREITRIIDKQISILRKKPGSIDQAPLRKRALDVVSACLQNDSHPAFTQSAFKGLLRYRKQIPEAEDLIRSARRK